MWLTGLLTLKLYVASLQILVVTTFTLTSLYLSLQHQPIAACHAVCFGAVYPVATHVMWCASVPSMSKSAKPVFISSIMSTCQYHAGVRGGQSLVLLGQGYARNCVTPFPSMSKSINTPEQVPTRSGVELCRI